MTMSVQTHTIPAGQFKARCLALLDQVAETGVSLVITKRGRPVARVVPVIEQEAPDLIGSVVWEGDIIAPVDEAWGVEL